jgi:hypothetical protein
VFDIVEKPSLDFPYLVIYSGERAGKKLQEIHRTILNFISARMEKILIIGIITVQLLYHNCIPYILRVKGIFNNITVN